MVLNGIKYKEIDFNKKFSIYRKKTLLYAGESKITWNYIINYMK